MIGQSILEETGFTPFDHFFDFKFSSRKPSKTALIGPKSPKPTDLIKELYSTVTDEKLTKTREKDN